MAKYDVYLASPIARSPKRRRIQYEASSARSRAPRKLDIYDDEEAATADEDAITEQAPPMLDTFPVQDLPRELRCMIWEHVVLQDNVFELDQHPALQQFGSEKPSRALRRQIPGYFRPTALLTRHEELFRRRVHQVYMINRIPALFLVSRETYIEAREVAFRRVVLEIDRNISRAVLQNWRSNIENPMLRNMRNLYLCTHAKIPKPAVWIDPMPFGTSWPMLDFDHKNVPLFHISVTRDGDSISLRMQREPVLSDKVKLDAAITEWRSTLSCEHRFSSKDLIDIAKVIQRVQDEDLDNSWTLRLDEQDRMVHSLTKDAQDDRERKTGVREFAEAWMTLEPDFRVMVMKLKAPCVEAKVAIDTGAEAKSSSLSPSKRILRWLGF